LRIKAKLLGMGGYGCSNLISTSKNEKMDCVSTMVEREYGLTSKIYAGKILSSNFICGEASARNRMCINLIAWIN